jgi:hypothetical protein
MRHDDGDAGYVGIREVTQRAEPSSRRASRTK